MLQPKIPWYIHMDLTFLVPLPRSPQALVILVLSGTKGRMGRAEVQGNGGAGTENPAPGGRTACELPQTTGSLNFTYKTKFKGDIFKNFKPAATEH